MKEETINLINEQLEIQKIKGKSFEHSDEVWTTIVIDYLGRTVRQVFSGKKADEVLLVKMIAVAISWLENMRSKGE